MKRRRLFTSSVVFFLMIQACVGIVIAGMGHVYSTWDLVELDTCASAWLIKRFVDQEAEFKFYPKGELIEEGIAFDTPDAELRRTHGSSTFESILQKYGITDTALIKIGKIIHDIEVNYWAGQLESESEKVNADILGIIKKSKTPGEIFREGFSYFDRLYKSL